jgi:hypothetical protein
VAIRFKLGSNYLYSFDLRDVLPFAVSTSYKGRHFNIMIEFLRKAGVPERVTIALEFSVAEKILRVITTILELRA